jgi:hypothetical protein
VAGYRDFQTGEVLTAANVNDFLMEQSVMTFADAAARDAALTDVLREGLLTYNLDTGALERYDGSAWVPAAPETPGIGSNVVQTVKTDTFTTTSTTFVDVTGVTVTITPSSDTSKVLVLLDVAAQGRDGTNAAHLKLRRGTTDVYVGDAAGSRIRAWAMSETGLGDIPRVVGVYLDSPGTTSPVTYSVQIRNNVGGQTVFVNRSIQDTDNNLFARVPSSITVIEVAP